MTIKSIIRKLALKLPFAITKNIANDQATIYFLSKILHSQSNTIDVGCHKGEIMDEILHIAKNGIHCGFEPIPFLYHHLNAKYKGKVTIYPYALSNKEGQAAFNLVTTNPAYSGLIKRKYDRAEEDQIINVEMKKLDDVLTSNTKIDFIKIDTEGAELLVLEGGREIISRSRPFILFEFGLGASDVYGTTPQDIYSYFTEMNYLLIPLENVREKDIKGLTLEELESHYTNKTGYSYIGWPN